MQRRCTDLLPTSCPLFLNRNSQTTVQQSDNNESQPLLRPAQSQFTCITSKLPDTKTVIAHLSTLPYNIPIVLLYWMSLIGLPVHLAKNLDEQVLNYNVTDLTHPALDWPIIITISGFAGLLLITNQRTMPIRLQNLGGQRNGNTSNKSNKICTGITVTSTGFKGFVITSSTYALFSMFLGLGWAIPVTLFFTPGIFAGQLLNLQGPFARYLCKCNLHWLVKKGLATYLTIGNTAGYVSIYFNTVNQGFVRSGFIKVTLINIHSLGVKIVVNILHAAFALNFGIKTTLRYFPGFDDFLSRRSINTDDEIDSDLENQTYNTDEENSENEEDSSPRGIRTMQANNYSIFDRVDIFDLFAASYKVIATYLSITAVSNILYPYEEADAGHLILFIFLAILQIFNFMVQLTFFSRTNKQLAEKGVKPGDSCLQRTGRYLLSWVPGCGRRSGSNLGPEIADYPDDFHTTHKVN